MISSSFEKQNHLHPIHHHTVVSWRSDIGGQFFNQSLGLFEHPDPGKVVPWFARGVLRVEGQGEFWGVGNRLFVKSIEHLSYPNTWQYMYKGLKRNILNEWTHRGKSKSDGDVQELRVSGDSMSIQTCWQKQNSGHGLQESGKTPSWQNPFTTLREAKTCRGEFYGISGYLLCYYIHSFAGFLNFVQECLSGNLTPPGRNGSLVPVESCMKLFWTPPRISFCWSWKPLKTLLSHIFPVASDNFPKNHSKGRDIPNPFVSDDSLVAWNMEFQGDGQRLFHAARRFFLCWNSTKGRDLPMPRWILVDFAIELCKRNGWFFGWFKRHFWSLIDYFFVVTILGQCRRFIGIGGLAALSWNFKY